VLRLQRAMGSPRPFFPTQLRAQRCLAFQSSNHGILAANSGLAKNSLAATEGGGNGTTLRSEASASSIKLLHGRHQSPCRDPIPAFRARIKSG